VAGESAEQIASKRLKPIKTTTVLGYLCDALSAREVGDDVWSRLRSEVGLTDPAKATAVRDAVNAHGADGIGAVKAALPSEYDYSVIKAVAAAMLAKRLHVFDIQPVVAPSGEKGTAVPASAADASLSADLAEAADFSDDDGIPLSAVAAHLKRSSPDATPRGCDGDDEMPLMAPVKVRKAATGLGGRVMPSFMSGGWKTKK
jgi:hypothetical protein